MAWKLYHVGGLNHEYEVKEWSEDQISKALDMIKECVKAGGEYETKGSCVAQILKEFVPKPLKDAL